MPPRDPSARTKNEIINVAGRLFDERGYDKVKIEDIVAEVGVTRGAFYHYFKSREELIYTVYIKSLEDANLYELAMEQKTLNGLEKLRFVLKHSLRGQIQFVAHGDALTMMYHPVVLKSNIFSSMAILAPTIEKLLIEGNKDGSTNVEFPKHMPYALIVICNEWLNPEIFKMSEPEFKERLKFISLFGEKMGVQVLDDELYEMVMELYNLCRVK